MRIKALCLVGFLLASCAKQPGQVKSVGGPKTQPAIAAAPAQEERNEKKDPPRLIKPVPPPVAAASSGKAAAKPSPGQQPPKAPATKAPQPANAIAGKKPADPPAVPRAVANLSIFQFSLPTGVISRNEEFWKHVDEQAIDAYMYDILFKNGIRVGRATLEDWEYFQKIIDQHPRQAKPAIYATTSVKYFELPMKRNLPQQTIYDFDARNFLNIRSYDASDNFFAIEFQAAPRKRGDVRVTLRPVVRSQRTRIVPTGERETDEFEFTHDEAKLPGLWTDVPLDQMLIIAPSSEATSRMSIGHSFLVFENNAQDMEQVLLILPQAMQLPERTTGQPTATTAAKRE